MKSGRFHDRWCFLLLVAWAVAVGVARAEQAPADPFAGRHVLVLNSYTEGVGAYEETINGFFAGVAAAGGRNDSVYTEKLDLLRFGTAAHRQALVELLRTRYASRKIDLLVTVQKPALDFALDEGRALFAGVPTIAAMVPEESFAGAAHPHVVRLPYEIDFSGTLDHARRLFPDTRRVVVAGGIGPADRVFIAQAKRAFASRQGEFDFEYLDDGDLERSLERLGRLPAGSVAIILTHYQTRAGLSAPHRGVLTRLARAASVPAFTQWASLLQGGAMVGGSALDVSAMGRQAAEAAADYLAGRKTLAQLRELPAVGSLPVFDWAQIERWRGDVSRLPAHSVFIGRPASLWAGHRDTVIVLLAVMAGLAGLLVALAVTNGRYRRTVRDHADRRDHLEGLVAERTQALAAALERAEAANRAKSVFLSSMSHELRTPLNSVIGFSALIARAGNLDESTRCNLEIINRSGRHLLTLINNILELSKIEAGRIELEEAPTDVAALAREVADMLLPQAEQAGLALEANIGDLPPALRVDAVKLRQVLLNLLANAIKFTREGSVTLDVRVVSRTPCEARIAFAVRDTGIGIAPEDRQRIFQPFVQVACHATSAGTGLGLAITRLNLRLLGSDLKLESALGAGSTFRFVLRLPTAEALAASAATAAHGEVKELEASAQGKRLLVVEDKPDARLLLRELLAPLGFVVCEAENGAEAVERVRHDPCDLILMDWRMPVLDGLEATRRIRALPLARQPKILMLSASALEEERRSVLAAGIDGFLRKPLQEGELFEALERHLNVRFERGARGMAPPSEPAPPPVTTDLLRALPEASRRALRIAIEELNRAKLDAALAQIEADQPDLARGIAQMARRFRYKELWALVTAV